MPSWSRRGCGKDLLACIGRTARAALDASADGLICMNDGPGTEPPPAELLAVRSSPGDDDALASGLSEQGSRATAPRRLASIEASGIELVLIGRLIIDMTENGEWQRWKSRLATRILLIGCQEAYASLADQSEEVVLVPDGLDGLHCPETSRTGFEETDRGSSRTVRARGRRGGAACLEDFVE